MKQLSITFEGTPSRDYNPTERFFIDLKGSLVTNQSAQWINTLYDMISGNEHEIPKILESASFIPDEIQDQVDMDECYDYSTPDYGTCYDYEIDEVQYQDENGDYHEMIWDQEGWYKVETTYTQKGTHQDHVLFDLEASTPIESTTEFDVRIQSYIDVLQALGYEVIKK